MFSLRAILMIAIGLGGCVVSLRRPYAGLLLVIFLYFFRPGLWGAEAYVRPVLWVSMAVVVGWYRERKASGSSPALRWLAVLLLLYAVSSIITAISFGARGRPESEMVTLADALRERLLPLTDIAKIFLTVFLISELCDTPKRLAGLMLVLLAGAGWFVKVSVLSWAAEGFSDKVRVDTAVGQGGGANYISWVLASTAALLVYKVAHGQKWVRIAATALLPLWVVGILATGSRGGVVSLAAGLLAMLLVMRRFRLVLVLGCLGLLFLRLAPAGRMERLESISLDTKKMDESMRIRVQHIQAGVKIIADHPFFGTGLDSFPRTKEKYLPTDYTADRAIVAHNTLIQMGSEVGLVFLAAFGVFGLYSFRCLLRRPDEAFKGADLERMTWVRVGLAGALAATAVQMLKGDMAKIDLFWWLFGLAITYGMVHTRALAAAAETPAQQPAQKPRPARRPWAALRAKAKAKPKILTET